jgi:hypothetical protein
MKTKQCIRCGEEKELSAFYKHSAMADGHLNKCIACCKYQSKEREERLRQNPDWVDKEKVRAREKYHRLNYKDLHKPSAEKKKLHQENYKQKFPEKIKARNKTQKLKPKTIGNHLHHWSYNEEHFKDVIELSVADHNTVHRYIIYDQERKMYRKLDGVLLDSREVSIEYYKTLGINLPF